jgi:hypothetical protein
MLKIRYITLLLKDIVRAAMGKPTATMQTAFELREERDKYKEAALFGLQSLSELGKRHQGGSVYARQQRDQLVLRLKVLYSAESSL